MTRKISVEYSDIVEALAVLISKDCGVIRKLAASIFLKFVLPREIYKDILEDEEAGIFPFDRNDHRVRLWKNKILSRGKCEICGSTNNLQAHHIIKWADYPQGRLDPNNGQCLCNVCHTNEHRHDQSYAMMKAKFAFKEV